MRLKILQERSAAMEGAVQYVLSYAMPVALFCMEKLQIVEEELCNEKKKYKLEEIIGDLEDLFENSQNEDYRSSMGLHLRSFRDLLKSENFSTELALMQHFHKTIIHNYKERVDVANCSTLKKMRKEIKMLAVKVENVQRYFFHSKNKVVPC